MPRTLAIFGGSFNPPGLHHWQIAEAISAQFDEVVIVPCGPRPDKATVNDIEPDHRAAMVDMVFRGLEKVRVELFDLEAETFTRTHSLDERFSADDAEVWHIVGADLVRGGDSGQSFIHREWERGSEIWHRLNFVVVTRPGIELEQADLPPNHRLFELDVEGTSSEIREQAFRHESIDGMVTPEVAAYIKRYGLYRGNIPRRTASFQFDPPRPLVLADDRNPEAARVAAHMERIAVGENDANLIVAIGGDGFMLHAVRQYWRRRLPFFGVNQGTHGFLLNDVDESRLAETLCNQLMVRRSPLLYVKMDEDASRATGARDALAFNEVWIERDSGQTAWIELTVDREIRIKRMMADGALLATAAGSTAYARAMGGPPLPVDTEALVLVGSNVLEPAAWKHAVLPIGSVVEMTACYPDKRPVRAFVDGVPQGRIGWIQARISRIAAVELAFTTSYDLGCKLTGIQFPNTKEQS